MRHADSVCGMRQQMATGRSDSKCADAVMVYGADTDATN